MNLIQAVRSGFKNYANFKGRASRSEYWYWTLFVILLDQISKILDSSIHIYYFQSGHPIPLILFLESIAVITPTIAVLVRRLHDINLRGWWSLIGITIIGTIFPMLLWVVSEGTEGSNRFGADPIARA